MKWFASIVLLLGLSALATGTLEYLHNRQHQREDAAAARLASDAGLPAAPAPAHDDSNCSIHLQLHMPIFTAGWVPLLVFLGLFIAFLTLLAPPLAPQRVTQRISCRGPPRW